MAHRREKFRLRVVRRLRLTCLTLERRARRTDLLRHVVEAVRQPAHFDVAGRWYARAEIAGGQRARCARDVPQWARNSAANRPRRNDAAQHKCEAEQEDRVRRAPRTREDGASRHRDPRDQRRGGDVLLVKEKDVADTVTRHTVHAVDLLQPFGRLSRGRRPKAAVDVAIIQRHRVAAQLS